MLIRYHERVGHLYIPNLRARLPNERGGYFVVTNSLGFRSDHEFEPKRNGRPRILMFGCSYTAGDNCPNEERYSDYLARELDCDVYNFGVSGSGTDQHLLIHREYAAEIEADLVVVCVQIDSMKRIQLSHRASVDRLTGKRVLVPKPYFELKNGRLELRHVPVPRERPEAIGASAGSNEGSGLLQWYRNSDVGAAFRRTLNGKLAPVRSALFRMSGVQPYPDFESRNTPGWQLMSAILQQFSEDVKPLPLLIVPIPTEEYYLHGLAPKYQNFFETLENPSRGVYVTDVSNPLISLPWKVRQTLAFRHGGHFTPFANEKVAAMMARTIRERKLLPAGPREGAPRPDPVQHKPRQSKESTCVLGISCFYHNSAAALVRDGEIVAAAEEERFSRVKNDRRFPAQSVNYVMEEGGVNPSDLRAVVYYDNASLTFERILQAQLVLGEQADSAWHRAMPSWIRYKLHLARLIREYLHYDGLVLQELHHRSHAASAFYPSPFERAAILTVDGVGEWATASIGAGRGSEVTLLQEMRFPHSLGLLYSAFTQFTGFKVNSGEYKMMGLAPYGEPKYVGRILSELVDLKDDGSLELNLDYFGFLKDPKMTTSRFADLFDGDARNPDSRITRREMDLARSVQWVTEESLLRMGRHAHKLTGERNLCLAGGVALNCVANGRLLREGPFQDLWIQPAAGDSGCALGAALDVYYSYFGKTRVRREDGRAAQAGSLLGPAFTDDEIRGYLETHGFPYREMPEEERLKYLVDFLAAGKVIGHFSGRMEYGPRALGARSILGDARNPEMQANLNLKIKYRESFRPFAPAVLAGRVSDYFELDRESPYMLIVAPVRKDRRVLHETRGEETGPRGPDADDLLPIVRQIRSDIPAVTHVDYSARIQTVYRDDHPVYYDLIRCFEEKTGYGVIVNTSFNVRGEPIVCTPADAYRCFMRTEMNVLNMGRFVLLREEQPPWPEGRGEGLESEDAEDRSVSGERDELSSKLGTIFRESFVPLADQLAKKGKLKIAPAFQRLPSMWTPVDSSLTKSGLFELPAIFAETDPDPAEFAKAVASYWDPTAQDASTLKLLERLVSLGLEYPPEGNLEEEVSESIYVMF
jgi:carbamoyltransferase